MSDSEKSAYNELISFAAQHPRWFQHEPTMDTFPIYMYQVAMLPYEKYKSSPAILNFLDELRASTALLSLNMSDRIYTKDTHEIYNRALRLTSELTDPGMETRAKYSQYLNKRLVLTNDETGGPGRFMVESLLNPIMRPKSMQGIDTDLGFTLAVNFE